MKWIHFSIVLICTAALMVLTFTLFRIGRPTYVMTVLALPVVIYFMNHPKILYAAILCTVFSNITFPGLPSTIFVYHLLCLLAAGIYVLNMAVHTKSFARTGWTQLFGFLFALNILVIISLRGAGLRVLGSSEWGGMRYFEMLMPLALIFLRPDFTYTRKEWNRIGVLFILFSSLPLVAEAVFLLSGGALYHQYYIVKFDMMTLGNFAAQYHGQDLVRFQSANRIGPVLALVAIALFQMRRHKLVWIGVYLAGFTLIGISGHRSGLIDLIMITFLGGWLYFKKSRIQYMIGLSFAGVFLLVITYNYAIHLPFGFQRMLMLLPGIEVSTEARLSAEITSEWRFDLWHEALEEIRRNPDFLILGKGMTYSSREYAALTLFDYHYWWAILTSSYHQGLLSLLIITGIPGLLSATGLVVSSLVEQARLSKSFQKESGLYFMHLMIMIFLGFQLLKFFIVYGDLTSKLPQMFHMIFALHLLSETLSREMEASGDCAVP